MSLRKPPRLASWLLDRFGVASQNPPLTGDLIEEFLGGRSAAWILASDAGCGFDGLSGMPEFPGAPWWAGSSVRRSTQRSPFRCCAFVTSTRSRSPPYSA